MGILSEINWQLVLIIAATSAVVSYVGDVLGMKLGKKRITIGNLRPRHTSTIITIITGVVVALITVVVASYASGQVRHAFFGVNYLDRQISQLTVDLRDRQFQLDETELEVLNAKQELERLRTESGELRRGLDEMKGGRVVVFGGEMLAQTTIDGTVNGRKIDDAITKLLEGAKEHLRGDGDAQADAERDVEITITDDERKKTKDELEGSSGRKVLRLIATSNAVSGRTVECSIEAYDTRLIYNEGDVIATQTVESDMTEQEAADLLYMLLRRTNRTAISSGVLQDGFSGKVGRMDSSVFYDTAAKIAASHGPRTVEIRAANDIWSEGPVDVKMEIIASSRQ